MTMACDDFSKTALFLRSTQKAAIAIVFAAGVSLAGCSSDSDTSSNVAPPPAAAVSTYLMTFSKPVNNSLQQCSQGTLTLYADNTLRGTTLGTEMAATWSGTVSGTVASGDLTLTGSINGTPYTAEAVIVNNSIAGGRAYKTGTNQIEPCSWLAICQTGC